MVYMAGEKTYSVFGKTTPLSPLQQQPVPLEWKQQGHSLEETSVQSVFKVTTPPFSTFVIHTACPISPRQTLLSCYLLSIHTKAAQPLCACSLFVSHWSFLFSVVWARRELFLSLLTERLRARCAHYYTSWFLDLIAYKWLECRC